MIDPDARVDRRAVVEHGCRIGPGSVVHAGAFLGHATQVDDHVVIGPNAALETAEDNGTVRGVHVESEARVGANATICAGVVLAARCVVRPGAVVTRAVPPRAIVEGNPAIITGYVDTEQGSALAAASTANRAVGVEQTPVRGVTLHRFPVIPDLRGSLTVGEFDRQIPFIPRRYFMVFGVPSREIRGEHAHLACHQFLICVEGSCAIVADDGHKRFEVLLEDPSLGVYLPPMTWGIQYKYSADAKLLVFASHHYDNADYVRDYKQYLSLVARREGALPSSSSSQESP